MIYTFILILLLLCFSIFKGANNPIEEKSLVKKYRGFIPVFFILAFFSAIRDDCGCDYNSYIMHIERIQLGQLSYMEPGFQFFVRYIEQYDDNPRLVIILMGVLTCFFFTLAIWQQSLDRQLSVYLLMTWGYYIMTYNTVRNYFALAVVLSLLPLIIQKRYILFSLLTILVALFHKSALFCIPVYIVASKITFKRKHILPMILLGVLFLMMEGLFRELVFILYATYEGSEYDNSSVSYLNILKALFVIWLYIRFKSKLQFDPICKLYFNLNVFALFIYISLYWLPEISRLGFYLNATTVLMIPRIIQNISNINNRKLMRTMIYIGSFFLFLLLLVSFSAETTRLLPYKTWLFNDSYNDY